MHCFDLYSSYIGNYKHAMETIIKCKHSNAQFRDIMDQDIRISSLKEPLKLEGLLYKPIDRMTQYSLLLNVCQIFNIKNLCVSCFRFPM